MLTVLQLTDHAVEVGGDLLVHLRDAGVTAVGDKFRFIAEVIEFNTVQCLFRLAPVSTETR
ncbi:uncharacterized protein DUF4839 [Streptomyces brevispora]|uniref:Uncharacterized protein DUF4839 n=1 Tax=Streptomyces brevispora TaxID=887462 RepID=A0A561V3M4_9ACTN|nr:uncharacterized protein DUF4839 [Streptomyces brevispora]